MGESSITEEENTINRGGMKITWERIQSITIVVLVIIILLMSKCSGGDNPRPVDTKVVTETKIVWDTLEVEKKVYVPKWRTKVETKYDTTYVEVPADVDTLSILKDYYSKYVYVDTIFLDTLGFIALTDTISENKILNRTNIQDIVLPTKIQKDIIYINEREFYAGMGVRTNGENISWMGLEGVFRNKRGNTFNLGIGTDNENNFSVGGGVHWRIGGN
jgi:hypothetical protein